MSLRPRLPRGQLLSLAASVARRERRSFAADCAALVASLPAPPEIRGLERVPAEGPLCVVANHYQRPGLWIGWAGGLLAHAVGQARLGDPPLHLLVVDCWPIALGGSRLAVPGSRWIFARVARAWSMTPLPSDPGDVAGRARALRELRDLALSGQAIGLFPEGEAGEAGEPGPSLPGVGRWLALLARDGVSILPAAVAEREDTLAVAFGEPLDRRSAAEPMVAIRAIYSELAVVPDGSRR